MAACDQTFTHVVIRISTGFCVHLCVFICFAQHPNRLRRGSIRIEVFDAFVCSSGGGGGQTSDINTHIHECVEGLNGNKKAFGISKKEYQLRHTSNERAKQIKYRKHTNRFSSSSRVQQSSYNVQNLNTR